MLSLARRSKGALRHRYYIVRFKKKFIDIVTVGYALLGIFFGIIGTLSELRWKTSATLRSTSMYDYVSF